MVNSRGVFTAAAHNFASITHPERVQAARAGRCPVLRLIAGNTHSLLRPSPPWGRGFYERGCQEKYFTLDSVAEVLSASSPCMFTDPRICDRNSDFHRRSATSLSFSYGLSSRGAGEVRQPRFYRRLEAYGFFGLCEGA